MATNVVSVIVYQKNQHVIPFAQTTAIAFPSQGCVLQDTTASPARSLSTGVNVYSSITTPAGDIYYASDTLATLVTAFNA